MNTVTKVKLIVTALAAVGTALSPHAHADAAHDNAQLLYTVDLARVGLTGDPFTEVVLGETICDNAVHGMSLVSVADRLIGGPSGVSTQTAVAIVSLAVIDLCPQLASSGLLPAVPTAPIEPPPAVTIVSAIT